MSSPACFFVLRWFEKASSIMSRLAIFIDGGYMDKLAARESAIRVDFAKFANRITSVIASSTQNPLDLMRTYYYHCLPYQSNPPTESERLRFSQRRAFFNALNRLEYFEVRVGRLAFRGYNDRGRPIFQQKRTDLMLGLDFALLSSKRLITHAALVAGDSDFIPAVQAAKQEGVSVSLFHGPSRSRDDATYAQELWLEADSRFELTQDFLQSCSM